MSRLNLGRCFDYGFTRLEPRCQPNILRWLVESSSLRLLGSNSPFSCWFLARCCFPLLEATSIPWPGAHSSIKASKDRHCLRKKRGKIYTHWILLMPWISDFLFSFNHLTSSVLNSLCNYIGPTLVIQENLPILIFVPLKWLVTSALTSESPFSYVTLPNHG